MARKKDFLPDERIGISDKELELGKKYLKKHMTAGAIDEVSSLKLYELFLLGTSFYEIQRQFPQYEIGQIILTAAIRKWGLERERMQSSIRERIRAKVIKSTIEQVDFLTSMLSVANTEYIDKMRNYIIDPTNHGAPELRITSIKDYKEVTEALGKIVQGATGTSRTPALLDTLAAPTSALIEQKKEQKEQIKAKEIDLDALLNSQEGTGE